MGYEAKFDKATRDLGDLAEKVAKESGISPNKLLGDLEANMQRIYGMRKSDRGKYRVLGVDKFDGSDWLQGEYDTPEEALNVARRKTMESMHAASHRSVATVFYAYDPKGDYLGGDDWGNNEELKKEWLEKEFEQAKKEVEERFKQYMEERS